METGIETSPTASQRSLALVGLGAAFALTCLITGLQLVDLAQHHTLNLAQVWGPLIAGTVQFLVTVLIGSTLRRGSASSRTVGAVTLALLAWLSIFLWWVATPAFLGITAAWVGGLLDRDTPKRPGSARIAGIVGLFAALANVVLILGALLVTVVQS